MSAIIFNLRKASVVPMKRSENTGSAGGTFERSAPEGSRKGYNRFSH